MDKPTVYIIKTTSTNTSLKSGVVFLTQLKSYNVFYGVKSWSLTGCFRQTVLHEWFEHSY